MPTPPPDPRLGRITAALATVTLALQRVGRDLQDADLRLTALRAELGPAQARYEEARRAHADLLARRDALLAERDAALAPVGGRARRPETSAGSVQAVLLALGGALLGVAAIVFTVVAWGAFGIRGRAAIILLVSVLALVAPVVLHRTRLVATAETVALLALVLVGLDGFTAWHLGWVPGSLPAAVYFGGVLGGVAALAALYPLLVPLRTVRPAAVLLAHPAAVLLAVPVITFGSGWCVLGLGVLLADLAVCRWIGTTAVRITAMVAAACTALPTLLLALASVAVGEHPLDPVLGIAVLIGTATAGLLAAELARDAVRAVARTLAAFAAVPLTLGGPIVCWLRFGPAGWAHTVPAALVLAAVLVVVAVRGHWRAGAAPAGAVVAILASAAPAKAVLGAFLAPLISQDLIWLGAPTARVSRLGTPGWDLVPTAGCAVVSVVVALAVLTPAGARRFLLPGGVALAAVLALLAPAAAGAPLWTATTASAAAAGLLLLAGVRAARPMGLAVCLAGGTVLGLHALVTALAARSTTLAVLAAATLGCAVLAAVARGTGTRMYLTGAALGASTGLAAASAVAAAPGGARLAAAGLALAAVAVPILGLGVALRHRRPESALMCALVGAAAGQLGPVLVGLESTRTLVALLACVAAGLGLGGGWLASVAVRGLTGQGTLRGVPGLGAVPGLIVALACLLVPALAVPFGPWGWILTVWSGAPADASAVSPGLAFPGDLLDPAALALLGILAAAVPGRRTYRWVGVPFAAAGVAELAPALGASWPAGLAALAVLTAGCAYTATGRRGARTPGGRAMATAGAVLFGLATVNWSLADRGATLTVLAVLVGAAMVLVPAARGGLPRRAAAGAGALGLVSLAVAAGAAARIPTAYPLLGAAAVLALVGIGALLVLPAQAGGLGGLSGLGGLGLSAAAVLADVRAVLETGAAAGACLAVLAALAHLGHGPAVLALTMTLLGAGVGLVALAPGRHRLAVLVLPFELVALWAWLALGGVATPEAYTLPAATLAGGLGLLVLRRRPASSSWPTLGPALATGAVPTGALALAAPGIGARALVLGIGAVAVLLAGAAARRQAPFVTGAIVLGILGIRSLALVLPALTQAIPAWVPLSLGGLVLLAVGATYEQRRREAVQFGAFVRHLR